MQTTLTAKMSSVSASELKAGIKAILKGADLSTLSSKKVRKQLEEKHDADFTERKKEIDAMLLELMEEEQEPAAESSSKDQVNGHSDNADHSDTSADDSGTDFEPPADDGPPKKKIKTPSKKKISSAESDEVDDEELAKQLQEEEESLPSRRTRGGGRTTPAKKQTKKATDKSNKPKKKNMFTKSYMLSPDLAALVGTDRLPRSEVVKKMWEIIKERDLQDKKNKHFMICDDELHKIFGRRRVKTFGMMKYLTNHILTQEEEDSLITT